MKKVISFSLWGSNPKYTVGALKNVKLAQEIYPDWTCRFYVDTTVPEEIIQQLKCNKNVEIIYMNVVGDWTGMFWRFYTASDPNVDVMISRDTDSRLNYREKFAVEEWLQSDKQFHIMRDCLGHQTEILGGMWGAKYPILSNMKIMIDNYVRGNFWQVDQNFLREKVYPIIKNNCLVHDEFFNYDLGAKRFPTPRIGGFSNDKNPEHFVGKPYYDDDTCDNGISWEDDSILKRK